MANCETVHLSTDDEGRKSGYETFVEQREIQTATSTSLLLAGARNMYGSSGSNGMAASSSPLSGARGGHRRALSFAETIQPLTLSWHNISVFTDPRNKKNEKQPQRQILHDVSGLVRPGNLLAVMGASGAGKSTLLNVLTYRNLKNLRIQGEVKVNGQPVGKGIKSILAYIQQDDIFVGTLKVREHLWFHAQLRMDREICAEDRQTRIEEVILEMGLKKCADTVIGVPGTVKGISGGEMKRLSFASEVLTNPPLMFCDEPTSGLDSYMAETVIATLQAMAKKGKTIICIIHQPSSEVYALFDWLLLLAEGRTTYLGPSTKALEFFQSAGFPCPVNYNPADHFVHCLAVRPGHESEALTDIADICRRYQNTPEYSEIEASLEKLNEVMDSDLIQSTGSVQRQSPYKASWIAQMRALIWRGWIAQARDANVFTVRIMQTLIVAVLIGVLYFRQVLNERGIMNINGALFLFLSQMTFTNFYTVLNSFPNELPIFYREHHNGMYRVDAYFLSKNISELFIFILIPTLFVTVSYWMMGLRATVEAFIIDWAVAVMVTKTSVSFGYFLSTAAGRIDLCLAFSGPMLLPVMLFGGYMLNIASIPIVVRWMQWLSWFRYGYEILMVSQWSGVTNITCTGAQAGGQFSGAPCFSTGEEVLRSMGLSSSGQTYLFGFGMLFALTLALRFLSFVSLWIRARG